MLAFSNDIIHKWHFPSYNFTIEWILSKLLLQVEGVEKLSHIDNITMHLDVLDDTWTSRYHGIDW